MSLTVLNVAYPFASVSVDAVGGAEQILAIIDEALVRAGHRSLIVACEGSSCVGTLLAVPRERGELDESARVRAWQAHRNAIARALNDWSIDVIHFHDLDFDRYMPREAPPMLATLHLPPEWYAPEIFQRRDRALFVQCVSASQRNRCPDVPYLMENNPNGVRLDRLWPARRKRNFALMLGRVCPEKGFDHALRAAHRADVPLVLAGRVFAFAAHRRYFDTELKPLLDARRQFIGPVGFARKRRLLGAARCVLIPSRVPETSSLVAMEALACGTPVIAYRAGALAEIIEHGRTGFLVDNETEMAEAIRAVDELSGSECRRAAEARFSASEMAQRYLDSYARLQSPAALPTSTRIAHMPRALRVQRIANVDELQALGEPWRRLCAHCPDATPFQRPEWLVPWCRHFGVRELKTVALWDAHELVALAPLQIYAESGRRILTQLGSGVSDYQDVLFAPAVRDRAVIALQNFLHEVRSEWDSCDFEQLRETSPLTKLALPDLGEFTRAVQDVCPQLDVRAETFALSPRLRRNLRYAERALAKLGSVTVVSATETTLDPLLTALIALHRKRWDEMGGSGTYFDMRIARLHFDAAHAFFGSGMLQLQALRLDDRVIAGVLGFVDARRENARAYCYLSGFDPEFAKYSPGALIMEHAIATARRAGAAVFDFLRGNESYKYAWGARDVPNYRRTLTKSAHSECGVRQAS